MTLPGLKGIERDDKMSYQDYMEDNLTRIEYDGHIWEVGHFGERNNGFTAYGFRQDGIYIRVTSQYESELIAKLFQKAL